jgi:hypothetical protein
MDWQKILDLRRRFRRTARDAGSVLTGGDAIHRLCPRCGREVGIDSDTCPVGHFVGRPE